MFIDGRTLNREKVAADICIVGAGAAGISIAVELAESGISVVLLESGDIEYKENSQMLYQGENTSFNNFPLEAARLRYLGGTTNHWGGFTARYSAFDFTPRPYMTASGWPIKHEALLEYYPRADRLCELENTDRHVDAWQKLAGFEPISLKSGPISTAFGQWSPPTRFGTVYREKLEKSRNIRVILNSNAQEFLANQHATHVDTVVVKCIGGTQFEVAARCFVIAMGGLETARLLLLSKKQQSAGLGNGTDLVGRHYMDHLGLTGGELRLSPNAPNFDFFTGYSTVGASRLHGIFTPHPAAMIKENIGNFRTMLIPRTGTAGIESLKELSANYLDPGTYQKIGYHLGNILVDIDQIADAAYKTAFRRKEGFLSGGVSRNEHALNAVMHVSAEQLPNPDSRVTLSDKTDIFGQPRIRLEWKVLEADRRTLRQSMTMFAAGISSSGFGRFRLPGEISDGNFDYLIETACHHSGTTRMSASPKTGVVDANCKVHSVDNLYIASSSVFPTASWVNPTLTIVALAIRLADHVKKQYA